MILRGDLRTGERLTQDRVAAQLGVARAPLRMVLEQLRHQGMLDAAAGGQYVVRSFSLREVEDAIHLRGQLEGSAARLAAHRRAGRDPLHVMYRCLAGLDRAVAADWTEGGSRLARYMELNDAFHAQLFVLAESEPLYDAYGALLALPFAKPSALIGYQTEHPTLSVPLGLAHAQHHEIVSAIAAGDGSKAEALARNHAEVALHEWRAVISQGAEINLLQGSILISGADAA